MSRECLHNNVYCKDSAALDCSHKDGVLPPQKHKLFNTKEAEEDFWFVVVSFVCKKAILSENNDMTVMCFCVSRS